MAAPPAPLPPPPSAASVLQPPPARAGDALRVALSVLDAATLSADVGRYREDAVEALRRHGGRFQAASRRWTLALTAHDALCADLERLPAIDVRRVPPSALRALGGGEGAPPVAAAKAAPAPSWTSVPLNGGDARGGPRPPVSAPTAVAAGAACAAAIAPAAAAPRAAAATAGSRGVVSGPAASAFAQDIAVNIHPRLRDFMSPFQLTGVQFCLRRGGRALVCDEMVRFADRHWRNFSATT